MFTTDVVVVGQSVPCVVYNTVKHAVIYENGQEYRKTQASTWPLLQLGAYLVILGLLAKDSNGAFLVKLLGSQVAQPSTLQKMISCEVVSWNVKLSWM